MNAESSQQVQLMIDDMTRQTSDDKPFHEGIAGLLRLLRFLIWCFEQCDTSEKVAAGIACLPDISEDELKAWRGFTALIPAALNEMVADKVREATDKLPSKKTGPKEISTVERATICRQVHELMFQKVKQGIAIKRIAQRTGRSERSVRRIYEQRDQLQTSFTMDEVKQCIAAFIAGMPIDPELKKLALPASAISSVGGGIEALFEAYQSTLTPVPPQPTETPLMQFEDSPQSPQQ